MSNPNAVLISDIHYSLPTLEVADAALRQAVAKANDLGIPLIIAGDLHDTKANLRAECVNRIIETLKLVETEAFIIVGNHDLTNERASTNALEFLDGLHSRVNLVRTWAHAYQACIVCIAYHSDPDELRKLLKELPGNYPGFPLVMHQGITGSNPGEYIQDKSAINKEDVADFRVISGHYHTRQDIQTGRPRKGAVGLWSYIGNPFTLNFGEANDPEKGFQILMDDGTLEFVPTNLRKHVVIDTSIDDIAFNFERPEADDIVLVRLRGSAHDLAKADKGFVRHHLPALPANFRLDLIPDEQTTTIAETQVKNLSQPELLDSLIESLANATDEQKERLKLLWKGL